MTDRKKETAVPENIRKIVERRGIKKKAVAQLAGYSPQQFSAILTGRKPVRAEDVLRIAGALNVTPNALFGVVRAGRKPAGAGAETKDAAG